MEWNPETLRNLSLCFFHTLSPATEPPRAAEKSLADAADSPNYGLVVLRLVAEHTVDDQIRHAAAVNFKNHLRYRWFPSSDSNSGTTLAPILDPQKEQIKALFVSLMLSSRRRESRASSAKP
ncbi:hypothetical protein LWI29_012237 [Acer saccharum]|uniref:Importin N-terminal domain-containing protein n=1 Tax=Acer saccharum TaxID=4024 RepID=A0AA39SXC0_ACESA|nr:hypothetical protein LWI29_012237 [Acer saccharum]